MNPDFSGKPEKLKHPDAVPVHVDLVPAQAVPGRDWICMMIVMPTFTKGEQCHKPIVGRIVTGGKTARTPEMRSRIY